MNDKLQSHGPWSVWSYATTSLNALSLKKYSSKLAADIDVGLHLLIDANGKSLRDMVSFMSGLIWNSVDVVVESCSSEVDPSRQRSKTLESHYSHSSPTECAWQIAHWVCLTKQLSGHTVLCGMCFCVFWSTAVAFTMRTLGAFTWKILSKEADWDGRGLASSTTCWCKTWT